MIEPTRTPLVLHKSTIAALYALSTFGAFLILGRAEAQKDLVTLLSTGAIFATFGSAISSLGAIWERDLLERVQTNIDIVYKDIVQQANAWRRWPFLARSAQRKQLDGSIHAGSLYNPEIPLDVGTHVIRVQLPTVLEDFFDLPLLSNFLKLRRFRSAANTVYMRKRGADENPETGMKPSDEYMAYECLHDTWTSILYFRLARYATHLGAGLTIAGAFVTVLHLATRAA